MFQKTLFVIQSVSLIFKNPARCLMLTESDSVITIDLTLSL